MHALITLPRPLAVAAILLASSASGDTSVSSRKDASTRPLLVVHQRWGLGGSERMLWVYRDGRVIRKHNIGYRLEFDTLVLGRDALQTVAHAVEAARQDSPKEAYASGISDTSGLEFELQPGAGRGSFVEGVGFDSCALRAHFVPRELPPQSLVQLCKVVGSIKHQGNGRSYEPDVAVHLELGEAHPFTKAWPEGVPLPKLDAKTSAALRFGGRYLSAFVKWGSKFAVNSAKIGKQSWDLTYDVVMPGD